jgi:hypothetical protein
MNLFNIRHREGVTSVQDAHEVDLSDGNGKDSDEIVSQETLLPSSTDTFLVAYKESDFEESSEMVSTMKDDRHLQTEESPPPSKLFYEYQFEMTDASPDTTLNTAELEYQKEFDYHGNSSWLSSVFNSVASIFGAGYVGVPYALSLAGLPLGIILLISMGFISGK